MMELGTKMKDDDKYETKLAKIEDGSLKTIAKDILNQYSHLSLSNGKFVCEVCKEGWSKVPRLQQEHYALFLFTGIRNRK